MSNFQKKSCFNFWKVSNYDSHKYYYCNYSIKTLRAEAHIWPDLVFGDGSESAGKYWCSVISPPVLMLGVCYRVVWSCPIRRPELWRSSTRCCCTASSSWYVTWPSVLLSVTAHVELFWSLTTVCVCVCVCVCVIRCCIKPLGARASAETVLRFVQRSECFYPVWDLMIWCNDFEALCVFDACGSDPHTLPASSRRYSDHLHRFHENGETWQ